MGASALLSSLCLAASFAVPEMPEISFRTQHETRRKWYNALNEDRAKPVLALSLAIVGVVAAPLRSDACSGSCGCGVGNAAFVICKMK